MQADGDVALFGGQAVAFDAHVQMLCARRGERLDLRTIPCEPGSQLDRTAGAVYGRIDRRWRQQARGFHMQADGAFRVALYANRDKAVALAHRIAGRV